MAAVNTIKRDEIGGSVRNSQNPETAGGIMS